MLLLFPKKFLFVPMGYFGQENDASSEFWIHSNDFLRSFHKERGEEAHWIILMVFPKKNIWDKWAILGPKIMCDHNSGSDRMIFRRFSTIKQPKRSKIILMVFLKKFSFRTTGLFWAKKRHAIMTQDLLFRFFENIAQSKGPKDTWK